MTSLLAVDTQPTPSSIRSHSAGKRGRGRGRGEGKRTRRGASGVGEGWVLGSEWAAGPQGRPVSLAICFHLVNHVDTCGTICRWRPGAGRARLDTLHPPLALSHKQDLISPFIYSNCRRGKQCHWIVFSDPTGTESFTTNTLTQFIFWRRVNWTETQTNNDPTVLQVQLPINESS